MRKQVKVASTVLVITLAGLTTWRVSEPREAVYQGKTLSSWLEAYYPWGQKQQVEEYARADEALRQMGTNALPFLLLMIRASDSPLRRSANTLLRKQRFFEFELAIAETSHRRAQAAFRALREIAKPAIPQLAQLLNDRDPDVAAYAADALGEIGPDSAGALVDAMHHESGKVRALGAMAAGSCAFEANHSGHEPVDAKMAAAFGSFANRVVPHLVNCLKDNDPDVRGRAAEALGFFGKPSSKVLSGLTELLADKDPWPRRAATRAIAEFGSEAQAAVPALVTRLQDEELEVRQYATNALNAIDHEAAAKAGVE